MDVHDNPLGRERSTRDRPSEPDHPMILEGGMVEGDTRLMLRILAEELLRSGIEPDALMSLSRDAGYQALYAARCALGDGPADDEIRDAITRVGAGRAEVWESGARVSAATLTVSARRATAGG